MNIEKADYGTVITFGTLDDLMKKMELENKTIDDVVNLKSEKGVSLLETSLVYRKLDISNYLLNNGADVNVFTKEGYNELFFLAPSINKEGAVEIGKVLLSKGVSVMHRDEKYGNTAFFTLCVEAFKCRYPEVMRFLEECFDMVTDIDEKNLRGISIRDLISANGSEELKKKLEEKFL